MCSWFSLKVDAPDEASFSSKISEGPKSSDELVFPRSWTKVLSLHSLLQPQIQMERALIEQHIFLGQDTFKLQINLERRGCQWRNLAVDHQGINQASSTTIKTWTQILGAGMLHWSATCTSEWGRLNYNFVPQWTCFSRVRFGLCHWSC